MGVIVVGILTILTGIGIMGRLLAFLEGEGIGLTAQYEWVLNIPDVIEVTIIGNDPSLISLTAGAIMIAVGFAIISLGRLSSR